MTTKKCIEKAVDTLVAYNYRVERASVASYRTVSDNIMKTNKQSAVYSLEENLMAASLCNR